jgi:hypothetical protein
MRNVVLLASTIATAFVLLGFGLFALDEVSAGSRATIERLDGGHRPAPGETGERTREGASGGPRELIADVNDVLLSPFAGVAAGSDSSWVRHGVPALLGLLAYGLLLRLLAGYLPAAHGPAPRGWEVPR